MIRTEILAIGNELLLGDVLDTNSNWVCKKITGLGGHVSRVVLIRDDRDAITEEMQLSIDHNAKVIFTIGGMGPTQDDLTVETLASGLNIANKVNQDALEIVKRQYEKFYREGAVDDAKITPAREKMANIPLGATPLDNQVGAAPGVLLKKNENYFICLPGVPSELKWIFENSLQPFLKQIFGNNTYLEKVLEVNCKDESILAPLLQEVSDIHPSVYIKSRAKRFGKDVKFQITVSTAGDSKHYVEKKLDESIESLREILVKESISIDGIILKE